MENIDLIIISSKPVVRRVFVMKSMPFELCGHALFTIPDLLMRHYDGWLNNCEWKVLIFLQFCQEQSNHFWQLLQWRRKREVVRSSPMLSPVMIKTAWWIDKLSSLPNALSLTAVLSFPFVQKQCYHDNNSLWCAVHVYPSKYFPSAQKQQDGILLQSKKRDEREEEKRN